MHNNTYQPAYSSGADERKDGVCISDKLLCLWGASEKVLDAEGTAGREHGRQTSLPWRSQTKYTKLIPYMGKL